MITKEVIELGFAMGVINLVVDPNMESGTVCQIGDNWFYFGGHTAEDESPEQYIAHVPFEDIVNEVFTTLEAFREDCNSEEYEYYETLLMGLPESVKLTAEQGVCRICCPESCLASWQCQRMHKATSHLPKIAKEDKCPMEARFSLMAKFRAGWWKRLVILRNTSLLPSAQRVRTAKQQLMESS